MLVKSLCLSTASGVAGNDENVALQGRAAQSSIYGHPLEAYLTNAMNAIDGNLDSEFHHGSCTHTNNDLSPWWRVDLLRSYIIAYITITNRGDCCGQRLSGAEILVGNSPANNGNNNPRCAVVDSIPTGGTQTFMCNGMVGRYVNIILRGKYEFLQLCEVQVFGDYSENCDEKEDNVALQGRATQSSIFRNVGDGYLSYAMNAIDGNLDSVFSNGSCSCTHNDPSPWWRVDLLKPYKVSYITITNIRDCCGERLNRAEILVGNSLVNNGNGNRRCAVVTSIPSGGTQTFRCDGMVGRYVNIILRGKTEYLPLCEVQVFSENAYSCLK